MHKYLLLIFLGGCAPLTASLPSFQHCDEVKYTRVGNQIEINAKCSAPIGSMLQVH